MPNPAVHQYRSRFAPSAASVAAVSGYLRAQGLRIAPVPANHLYVRASGTVIHLQKAFHTTLMTYRAGAVHAIAPTGAARLSASAAADVADTPQADTSLTAARGYDDQTGLGSPNGAVYVSALSLLERSETILSAACCRRS